MRAIVRQGIGTIEVDGVPRPLGPTMRKEVATLRVAWTWGRADVLAAGRFSSPGFRYQGWRACSIRSEPAALTSLL